MNAEGETFNAQHSRLERWKGGERTHAKKAEGAKEKQGSEESGVRGIETAD